MKDGNAIKKVRRLAIQLASDGIPGIQDLIFNFNIFFLGVVGGAYGVRPELIRVSRLTCSFCKTLTCKLNS